MNIKPGAGGIWSFDVGRGGQQQKMRKDKLKICYILKRHSFGCKRYAFDKFIKLFIFHFFRFSKISIPFLVIILRYRISALSSFFFDDNKSDSSIFLESCTCSISYWILFFFVRCFCHSIPSSCSVISWRM